MRVKRGAEEEEEEEDDVDVPTHAHAHHPSPFLLHLRPHITSQFEAAAAAQMFENK